MAVYIICTREPRGPDHVFCVPRYYPVDASTCAWQCSVGSPGQVLQGVLHSQVWSALTKPRERVYIVPNYTMPVPPGCCVSPPLVSPFTVPGELPVFLEQLHVHPCVGTKSQQCSLGRLKFPQDLLGTWREISLLGISCRVSISLLSQLGITLRFHR